MCPCGLSGALRATKTVEVHDLAVRVPCSSTADAAASGDLTVRCEKLRWSRPVRWASNASAGRGNGSQRQKDAARLVSGNRRAAGRSPGERRRHLVVGAARDFETEDQLAVVAWFYPLQFATEQVGGGRRRRHRSPLPKKMPQRSSSERVCAGHASHVAEH